MNSQLSLSLEFGQQEDHLYLEVLFKLKGEGNSGQPRENEWWNITRFAKKKSVAKSSFPLKTLQEQQKYNPSNDSCYSKNTVTRLDIPVYFELSKEKTNEGGNLTSKEESMLCYIALK